MYVGVLPMSGTYCAIGTYLPLCFLFQELDNRVQCAADLLYSGAEDLTASYCLLCGHSGRLLPGSGPGGR